MFSNREETDFTENYYYKINQILLSALDLWPQQRSKFANINHIFHITIILSFIFVQCTSLLTSQVTTDFLIMVLSYALPSFLYIIQYCSFYANPNAVKQMWKDIRGTWSLLKNDKERDIMRQYSSSGKRYTILFAAILIMSFILYMFIELLPTILDIIFPLNETRPRELHIVTEYFVDQRTYYYLIICHWMISLSFCIFVTVAITTLELIYVEHICGLLRIASYRIEHSIDKYVHNSAQEIGSTVLQNISSAVDIHRKALKCCEFVATTFKPTFSLIIIFAVTSLSLNLFRLFRMIMSPQNVNELIISIILVGCHFLFMFLANYCGQKITDYNSAVFKNTYNTRWYKAPAETQKLLLFIMQNTTKVYNLNIGNIIVASIEGFAKLASTSISYFTLIYSLL